MKTDEEIKKTFARFRDEKPTCPKGSKTCQHCNDQAAIRLYCDAFKAGQDDLLKNDELIREWTEQARADERGKWAGVITHTEWERLKAHETDTDKFTEGCARNVCRLMNEAYARARASAKNELSKLFALNHVPCDNPKCLCQSREFEEYWKRAGIEKRTKKKED